MSGILYVVMAILVILLITALRREIWESNSFKMHLNAKNQQIADIRRETEDEMRTLFENEVKSLHSEINRLCEERSKLQRTINLQAAQLEKLEGDLELSKMVMIDTLKDFVTLDREKSELSGISVNGVPLTRKELDDELESGLQAEYPSEWLYGDGDLLSLPDYDYLHDREVPSHKKGLKRGEERLHDRKDNTRQSSYRRTSVDNRKARKLVELQNYEGGE